MKAMIKLIAVTGMLAFAAPAFAGGVNVYDDGESKLKLEAKFFLNTKFTKKTNQAGITDQTSSLAVDRAYFGAKYYFNDDWMMRITTDTHLDTALGKKNNNIFLKYAYVEGKLMGKALVLRLGQSHTPWIDYEQGLWKHRYVSKVFVDSKGFDSSSDLGLGLKGTLADGMFKYWITETAGAGYSHPGMHKDVVTGKWAKGVKAFDFNGRLGIYPINGLTMDFQIRDGFKGTKYFDKANSQTTPGTRHTLYQGMLTYGAHDWRVGTNYLTERSSRRLDALNAISAREDKTNGFDLWAWANLPGTAFGAFGRFEQDKLKRSGTAVNPTTKRYVLGLEYTPVKHIAFSLVYDYGRTKDAGFVTGNYSNNTTYGLYSQIKF